MSDRFKIDSKLARHLASKCKSPEYAIREFVDNAWDADASHVEITLPSPLTRDPIVIEDDGSAMSRTEVSEQFLFIARNRRETAGEKTAGKARVVRGRQGIGKFAGLLFADRMTLSTWRDGILHSLRMDQRHFDEFSDEIHQLPIDIDSATCEFHGSGTRVTLDDISQTSQWPNEQKLAELLVRSYGRMDDFEIAINRMPLTLQALRGQRTEGTMQIQGIGRAAYQYVVCKKDVGRSLQGIVVYFGGRRVPGKLDFGLKEHQELPQGLYKKITGVLDIVPDDDGTFAALSPALFRTSTAYELVKSRVEPILAAALRDTFYREINLQKARIERENQQRLSQLPEHKRTFATRAIEKVLINRFGKKQEDVQPLVSVVLDAVEHDEYAAILREINGLSRADVVSLAEALEEFGLCDMAQMMRQARSRMSFLDHLQDLVSSTDTLERELHTALERNLWIFGTDCTMMSSNKTLKTIVSDFLNRGYAGDRGTSRPDLLLAEGFDSRRLLIEFKRPSHVLGHSDYQQATGYRYQLLSHGEQRAIRIILIGGRIDPSVHANRNTEPDIQWTTYLDLIATARKQLEFYLRR